MFYFVVPFVNIFKLESLKNIRFYDFDVSMVQFMYNKAALKPQGENPHPKARKRAAFEICGKKADFALNWVKNHIKCTTSIEK